MAKRFLRSHHRTLEPIADGDEVEFELKEVNAACKHLMFASSKLIF